MGRRLVAWILIWLVPIIPIVVLYLLFEEYNVFEFQDAPGGLKAFGPIGAYLVLVWLAMRNRRLLEVRLGDDERRLLGSWELISRSWHGHHAAGTCRITEDDNMLCLAGTFTESSELTSTWRSTIARLDHSQLLVVYELNDRERNLSSEGLMKLIVDNTDRPARLEGDWAIVGREGTRGTVAFTRAKASAATSTAKVDAGAKRES